ncbi:unnamed protein product [Amoebophrya sp. A120]|nr:unnamed protein product [Amoebophrya sp. A120]|eukprot:GSA120T00024778001.1
MVRFLFLVAMPEEGKHLEKVFDLTKDDDTAAGNPFIDLYSNTKFCCSGSKNDEEDKKTTKRQIFMVVPKRDKVHNCPSISSESAAVCAFSALNLLVPIFGAFDLVVSAGTCGGIQQPLDVFLDEEQGTSTTTATTTTTTAMQQGDVFVAKQIRYLNRFIPFDEYKQYLHGSGYKLVDPKRVKTAILADKRNKDTLRVFEGNVATSNTFVTDDSIPLQEKAHVCEMEAAAQARICCLMNDVPFTAVKIVSDVDLSIRRRDDEGGTGACVFGFFGPRSGKSGERVQGARGKLEWYCGVRHWYVRRAGQTTKRHLHA